MGSLAHNGYSISYRELVFLESWCPKDTSMAAESKRILNDLWIEAFSTRSCAAPSKSLSPKSQQCPKSPSFHGSVSLGLRSSSTVLGHQQSASRLQGTVLRTWRGSAVAPFAPLGSLSRSHSATTLDMSMSANPPRQNSRPSTAPGMDDPNAAQLVFPREFSSEAHNLEDENA